MDSIYKQFEQHQQLDHALPKEDLGLACLTAVDYSCSKDITADDTDLCSQPHNSKYAAQLMIYESMGGYTRRKFL